MWLSPYGATFETVDHLLIEAINDEDEAME